MIRNGKCSNTCMYLYILADLQDDPGKMEIYLVERWLQEPPYAELDPRQNTTRKGQPHPHTHSVSVTILPDHFSLTSLLPASSRSHPAIIWSCNHVPTLSRVIV